MYIERLNSISNSIDISNSVVVVDEAHRKTVGLEPLEDNCSVVASLDEGLECSGKHASLTIVDSRPDVILDNLATVRQEGLFDSGLGVNLMCPRWLLLSLFEDLEAASAATELAVSSLSVETRRASIGVRRRRPADDPFGAFIKGYILAQHQIEAPGDVEAPMPKAEAELRRKYLSLMEAVASSVSDGYPIEASKRLPSSEAPISSDLAEASEREELKRSLKQAIAERDSLGRKYESLSKSSLGRVTLKYWAWRRGGKNLD